MNIVIITKDNKKYFNVFESTTDSFILAKCYETKEELVQAMEEYFKRMEDKELKYGNNESKKMRQSIHQMEKRELDEDPGSVTLTWEKAMRINAESEFPVELILNKKGDAGSEIGEIKRGI